MGRLRDGTFPNSAVTGYFLAGAFRNLNADVLFQLLQLRKEILIIIGDAAAASTDPPPSDSPPNGAKHILTSFTIARFQIMVNKN
jgi:hypothetical protein